LDDVHIYLTNARSKAVVTQRFSHISAILCRLRGWCSGLSLPEKPGKAKPDMAKVKLLDKSGRYKRPE